MSTQVKDDGMGMVFVTRGNKGELCWAETRLPGPDMEVSIDSTKEGAVDLLCMVTPVHLPLLPCS